jgi:nitroreductase
MVRGFTDRPVPWATVERLVRAAQRAPSAGFAQGVSFVAVTDPLGAAEPRDPNGTGRPTARARGARSR